MAKRIIGLYQLFTITLIELLLQLLKLNPIILWFRKVTVVQISLTQKRIIIKITIIVKHKDVGLKEILLNPCVFYTKYLRSNICFSVSATPVEPSSFVTVWYFAYLARYLRAPSVCCLSSRDFLSLVQNLSIIGISSVSEPYNYAFCYGVQRRSEKASLCLEFDRITSTDC